MTVDLRTDREKERDRKHSQIRNEYLAYANQMPGTSNNRILRFLAQKHGMTIPGIRNILIKAGLYNVR